MKRTHDRLQRRRSRLAHRVGLGVVLGSTLLLTSCIPPQIFMVFLNLFLRWGPLACLEGDHRVNTKFIGSKRMVQQTYELWEGLQAHGEGNPPNVLFEGANRRPLKQYSSFFQPEAAFKTHVDLPSANAYCKTVYLAWDCFGDPNAVGCATYATPMTTLGIPLPLIKIPLLPAGKQRRITSTFYRNLADVESTDYHLGFTWRTGLLGHEALHADRGGVSFNTHNSGPSRDQNDEWVYGGGVRFGAALAGQMYDAFHQGLALNYHGHLADFRETTTFNAFSGRFAWFRDRLQNKSQEALDNNDFIETIASVAGVFRQAASVSSVSTTAAPAPASLPGWALPTSPNRVSLLSATLGELTNTPACTPAANSAPNPVFEFVDQPDPLDDYCRLRENVYLPDTGEAHAAQEVAIIALNPRFTISESHSQSDFDDFEAQRITDTDGGGNDYFVDVEAPGSTLVGVEPLEPDQTAADFCAALDIDGGGWRPLPANARLDVDASGNPVMGNTRPQLFEKLADNAGVLDPVVLGPSVDQVTLADSGTRFLQPQSEPLLAGIGRGPHPITEVIDPGSGLPVQTFAGHTAATYALRYATGAPTPIDRWVPLGDANRARYFSFEEAPIVPHGLFVDPDQQHAAAAGLVVEGPAGPVPQTPIVTGYQDMRVLCFKVLPPAGP